MTAFDQFEKHLSDAGDAMALRNVRSRRRRRLATIALTGTLAFGGVAAAAAPLWQPLLGDDQRGNPTTDRSAVPADQLEAIGALRRPQTPGDRAEATRYALTQLPAHRVAGVRLDGVRAITPPDTDVELILIPAQAASEIRDALCLFVADEADGGAMSCFATSDVLEGGATLQTAGPASAAPSAPELRPTKTITPSDRITTSDAFTGKNPEAGLMDFYGLVPDGVSRVRIDSVDATVRENAFHLRASEATSPRSIEWFDRAGRPVSK
ncbi:hypothetical protein OJ997_27935 [Solirubrobacter phytolaccae]|uniref:Uncharacterized protein n=1 Tax=Solirubrobacter phytolaccae TaxID=1404360 RepID=A0A9X3SID1_9ACTN|nr:hypothetical protein [Solirubrobacter phytolaccae]MDA0184172.1 hypothetical protein [Solirubrobacter phytolaccae]